MAQLATKKYRRPPRNDADPLVDMFVLMSDYMWCSSLTMTGGVPFGVYAIVQVRNCNRVLSQLADKPRTSISLSSSNHKPLRASPSSHGAKHSTTTS